MPPPYGLVGTASSSVASSVKSSVSSVKSSSSSSVVASSSKSSVVASSSKASSSVAGCTTPAYSSTKLDYKDGDKVKNVGYEYTCIVAGWCNQPSAYAPGVGWAWNGAWAQGGVCN